MSTTTLKFKSGTTAQWLEAKRILEDREMGLEVTTELKYILRIGDGKTEFTKLPAVISTPYFDEICKQVNEKYEEVKLFEENMTSATSAANTAATAASQSKVRADAAAKACEDIAEGMNTMVDPVTLKTYRMGIENGNIYLQEVIK